MAQIPVKNGEEITAPNIDENEIVFDGNSVFTPPITVAFIEVISGTIQFSSGEEIVSTHRAWPVESKFPMSFKNGIKNLRFKADSNTDKFVITF